MGEIGESSTEESFGALSAIFAEPLVSWFFKVQ